MGEVEDAIVACFSVMASFRARAGWNFCIGKAALLYRRSPG